MTVAIEIDSHGTGLFEDPDHIDIGVGEWAAARHPRVIGTQALGSCVGVTLWDAQLQIGAMAHVMLPSPMDTAIVGNPDRFASSAIPAMAAKLRTMGSPTRRLVAKLAGGAAMFRGDSTIAGIGDRNVVEVRSQLSLLRIPILAEDTGGNYARTVELHLDTGLLIVRSYRYGIHEL